MGYRRGPLGSAQLPAPGAFSAQSRGVGIDFSKGACALTTEYRCLKMRTLAAVMPKDLTAHDQSSRWAILADRGG